MIDRKKRDKNEKKRSLIPHHKVDEEKRHSKLLDDIKTNSVSDHGNEFTVVKGVLTACGSDAAELRIPADLGIKSIGDYAFTKCGGLESITIPKGIKSIGNCAFSGCTALETVNASDVKTIGASAFEDCTSLKEITFSSKLKKIGKYAFENCPQTDFRCPAGSYAAGYAARNYIYCIDTQNTAGKQLTANQVIKAAKSAQKIKPMLNLNMIVLGGSGTGKSRFFVKPNLMQLNTSFVVTDPSGELLESCGMMLKRAGYKIKVFNIDNMSHSDNYNPFHYLKEIGSDRKYKPENVTKMINTFLVNTKGEGQGSDPFWDNATEVFLSSIIFYMLEDLVEEEWNWAKVLEIVHLAEVDEEKKTKSRFDELFEDYRQRCRENGTEDSSLALKSYTEFTQAAGKTMQSILINTTARLKNFKLQEVINLTSEDTIQLETLGDEKTALFIIIPSTDTTYNYLAAMMYTQLFDSLYSQAIHKYHGHLPVPVRCILDEFANVGKIPEFDKVLATCRKFDISAVVILRNLSQLKRIYEKSWEELPGNCDTMLYLGGKDQFTNEYIMKSLGKETIDTTSINKSKGKQGSTSYNDGILGRELLQLNELETMDNSKCIVMIRGLNPFFTDKFEIKNHINYNMLSEVNESRNFFNIDENVHTSEIVEPVFFESMISDNDVLNAKIGDIEINFVSSESGEKVYTLSEIKEKYSISPEAQKMFDDGVFGISA